MAENVLLEIRGDIRDIKSKFSQIESTVKKTSGKVQKQADSMTSKFKKMGSMVKAAFVVAGLYKFVRALGSTAKAASDLEEQTAKFGTVFRGSLEEANKSVENLTENFAMSNREAKEFMSGVQDMLVPMGLARDKAAVFSDKIVQLAGDLGSFNNIPTANAMNKIKSALVGMYRPMREVGVVLSATTVAQRALKDGLAATEEELTAADKALTAYKMMVEMSADAIGDMARTSDSFANTIKRTNAEMEDFKAAVGKYVIPALGFWAEKANTVLDTMTKLIDKTSDKIEATSMLDFMKQEIADVSIEMDKYKAIMESSWRIQSEKASAEETYNSLLADRTKLYEQLVKFKKANKDIDYTSADANTKAEAARKAAAEAVAKEEEALKKLNAAKTTEIELTKYRMGMISEELREWEHMIYIGTELNGQLEKRGEIIKGTTAANDAWWESLNNVKKEMSDVDKFALQAAGSVGGTFASIITGANSAEDAVRKLAFQLASMAAMSFISGGWGQFLGAGFGMLGAPAPSPIKKPKPQTQTIGQQRQNMTLSTPMYGRRFIKEMNSGAVNVDSITAWNLG